MLKQLPQAVKPRLPGLLKNNGIDEVIVSETTRSLENLYFFSSGSVSLIRKNRVVFKFFIPPG